MGKASAPKRPTTMQPPYEDQDCGLTISVESLDKSENSSSNAGSTSSRAQNQTTNNNNNAFSLNSPSLPNRVLSLSTTSITSLLPSFYSLGTNYSMPTIGNGAIDNIPQFVSDELARESDVTVSTNITPQAEYKGFASYVISCIFMFSWLAWALLPDPVLNSIGIYYYPSRWWALSIPSYVLVSMMYTYVSLALYNIEVKTAPLNDLRTIVDDTGIIVTELDQFRNEDMNRYLFHSTSGIWDIPISEVNRVLYSECECDDES